VVFSERVYQSEHEAVKTFSVVLKMSENSLNILRTNIKMTETVAVLTCRMHEPQGARRYLNAVLDSRTHEL
jgi:hypothetical protein